MSTPGRRTRSGLRLAIGAGLAAVLTLSMGGAAMAANRAHPATVRPAASRTDVYTRDNIGDVGVEPNPSSLPFWASPDIRACLTAIYCASDQALSVGGSAYLFVNLNNPGPYGSGVSQGTLHVYYTVLGGAAQWSSDWTEIGTGTSLPVYPGVTQVTVPWASVPDDGPSPGAHFCLLTRWVSGTDPMVFEGPNTVANTTVNNNIAWHNLAPITLTTHPGGNSEGGTTTLPFAVGNVLRVPATNDLVFTEPGGRFEAIGTVTVDLGQVLFERWKQAGGQGTAIRPVGGTKVQILDLAKARIAGLTVNPGERPQVAVTFAAAAGAGQFTVDVDQVGPGAEGAKPTDIGGVEYDLTVKQG